MTRFVEITRTQEEIFARAVAIAEDDLFGFAREVLCERLDFEHVKPLVHEDATPEDWYRLEDLMPIGDAAEAYLAFAMGKADNHRGISAHRSVSKLREMAWLAGLDDVVQAMDDAPYPQYGVPKLLAFATAADLMNVWIEGMTPGIRRMSVGAPCEDGCPQGCNS